MSQLSTLNRKQLDVLAWIADGCPEGVMDGYGQRITAAALARRGLVAVSGHGPTWQAQLTEKGRRLLSQAKTSSSPPVRPRTDSVIKQLIAEIVGAGGVITVPQKKRGQRGVSYELRAEAAGRLGFVPEGLQLVVTPLPSGMLRLELVALPEGADYRLLSVPIPEPDRKYRFHPATRRFVDWEQRRFSEAMKDRARLIIEAVLREAERRGYGVEFQRKSPLSAGKDVDRRPIISIGSYKARIDLFEPGVVSPAEWMMEFGPAALSRGALRARCDEEAMGFLVVEIVGAERRNNRPVSWGGRRKSTGIENKLPELFRELEIRAAEHRIDNAQRDELKHRQRHE